MDLMKACLLDKFLDESGVLDFRRAGGKSKQARTRRQFYYRFFTQMSMHFLTSETRTCIYADAAVMHFGRLPLPFTLAGTSTQAKAKRLLAVLLNGRWG